MAFFVLLSNVNKYFYRDFLLLIKDSEMKFFKQYALYTLKGTVVLNSFCTIFLGAELLNTRFKKNLLRKKNKKVQGFFYCTYNKYGGSPTKPTYQS